MNTCTRSCLPFPPWLKQVVLPWSLFVGLAGAYIVVVTIGLLSQLLHASLSSHPSLVLSQGGTCSLNFDKLVYVRVKLETNDYGPVLLGFMDTGTGEFVLNRTLSTALRHTNFETEVIIPLHRPTCAELLQQHDYKLFVFIANDGLSDVSYVESSCDVQYDSAFFIEPDDVQITVYFDISRAEVTFHTNGSQPIFFVGLGFTALLFIFFFWKQRSNRVVVAIYVMTSALIVVCVIYLFADTSHSRFHLASLALIFIFSMLPVIHLSILFIRAHLLLRSNNRTAEGRTLLSLVFAPRMRVVPVITLPRSSGSKTEMCQYYCPICMLYHETTFKTSCCAQYVCSSCIRDYVTVKRQPTIVGSPPKPAASVDCPYCAISGVSFVPILPGEAIRSYEDSPKVTARGTSSGHSSFRSTIYSSLKATQDPFERLKAKLIPYEKPPSRKSSVASSSPPPHIEIPLPHSTAGEREKTNSNNEERENIYNNNNVLHGFTLRHSLSLPPVPRPPSPSPPLFPLPLYPILRSSSSFQPSDDGNRSPSLHSRSSPSLSPSPSPSSSHPLLPIPSSSHPLPPLSTSLSPSPSSSLPPLPPHASPSHLHAPSSPSLSPSSSP